MANRRRAHRAAAARLTVVAALLSGCGGEESPALADRTLSVKEALRANGDGPVRVRGTLIVDRANEVRLCRTILESHPPQCVGPSLVVRGLDLVGVSNMEQAKGGGWTSRVATLVGEVDDGVLTVAR